MPKRFNKASSSDVGHSWRLGPAVLPDHEASDAAPSIIYEEHKRDGKCLMFGRSYKEGCVVLAFINPEWDWPENNHPSGIKEGRTYILKFDGLRPYQGRAVTDLDAIVGDYRITMIPDRTAIYMTIRSADAIQRFMSSFLCAQTLTLRDRNHNLLVQYSLDGAQDAILAWASLMTQIS